MKILVSFLTSKELIIVYALAITVIIFSICMIIGKKSYEKRKKKHNTKELNKLVEEVNERLEEDKVNSMLNKEITEAIPEVVSMDNKLEESSLFKQPEVLNIKTEFTPHEEVLKPTIEVIGEEENNNIVFHNPETLETSTSNPVVEPIKTDNSIIEQLEEIKPTVVNSSVEVLEIPPVEQEELQYEEIEVTPVVAQAELEKLTKELAKAEETVNIKLTDFEAEQEENAIISIEELLKKGDQIYEANEVSQYADEGDEPISISDLENRMKPVVATTNVAEEPTIKMDDFQTIEKPSKTEYKKFQSSPVISPVYGIENKTTSESIELENTANYEKLDDEIRKTNEFLSTLRELQEKLR